MAASEQLGNQLEGRVQQKRRPGHAAAFSTALDHSSLVGSTVIAAAASCTSNGSRSSVMPP